MEQITTAGIDLAKPVLALHGVDGAGEAQSMQQCRLVVTTHLPLNLSYRGP